MSCEIQACRELIPKPARYEKELLRLCQKISPLSLGCVADIKASLWRAMFVYFCLHGLRGLFV